MLISLGLLVQADEGTLLPVVDFIRRNLSPPTVKCRFPRETGRSQAPRRQQGPMGRFKPIIGLLMLDLGLHITTKTTQNPRPRVRPPLLSLNLTPPAAALRRPVPPPCAVFYMIGLVPITRTRSFHPCQNPSDLLVRIYGGILISIVDLIDDLPPPTV
ncbi:hypothetical protein F511_27775 [Dorcoceras hygrometricum]|uniref:Uncharacterized protein n=1 Tax=Dorcoceras hygrometricum TaxID=472368 RepID=A0A2Z7B131_9LAMI|nr:hypothetical protein F511_27775 [Dorcoceras hygrometricum]